MTKTDPISGDSVVVAGSIYLKQERYYWKVRFPGEDKARIIALKPVGSYQARMKQKLQ